MFDTITDRKIKFALVGCGRISKNHFNSLEVHKNNAELVAVCDTDPVALNAATEKTGAKGFDNLHNMLDNISADIIILTTPSGLHPEQAIACLEKGFHVITEKPMATRFSDGEEMVKAADKAGKRLFVVKQNRLNATLQLLKRAVEEKRFGQINMVHLNVFWTRPQDYYDQAAWRGTWEFDGGAFMNQASHYIDLLEWLIGPVRDIQAMMSTHLDIEAEDTGVLNIRWRNGALGSVAVTMCTYPKNLEGSITILGEKGSVRVGGLAVNEIQEWNFADEKDYDQQVKNANYETTSVYGFGHPLYYKNVIDVMRGEAEPITDGREGLKSLELLIAAYLAARDNKTVSLPLVY
ncbi:Gfo/Idh/MocA family protein [Xenorhabdus griffiniae]|uniref:Gfo/Idh/MocA family oxidoreductase n=1 Tax=Xenorhabdus griffiniae TaxID=351672 RepID=A0ABY9XHL5_9GAMM|nr:Gfo/Idh/MocA family oxidoreductase [Xenorhabdus griffiniae]MBD1228156.1 Gfo/Idh/MocA family oxidoreductase [Xenorhabdus griffiniae]MBE8587942.1 Gfo/Idh/MocA family oxidoreductase [Xenorhabdus griffiniae]WMV72405.1 Gfo/Idh/MocA family oxidoreductase [Xenorhabdus griffiniae]WNH02083.1 Gfo/Idh/MocA family oxidoreductase [Xenorhabdus griffiniae]